MFNLISRIFIIGTKLEVGVAKPSKVFILNKSIYKEFTKFNRICFSEMVISFKVFLRPP